MSKVEKREISGELRESYLDYAMSVIVSRALPDARDGLKPVHRRILWAMWDSGLTHLARFRKSANVVGETMARYHPHGDLAIYDSLVRMAQDFSLRYPLVSGQGNFGCFTADTEVLLTDGRRLSFRELVKEYREGKKNYTYTINTLGLISVAQIQHPRRTRKNAELVKVILDNAEEIRCTPDHLFMLLDGSYKKAKDLSPEDPLMPLYQKISERTDRINRKGYLLVYQNKMNEWVPAHHLADNYNLTHKAYRKSAGRVRHHVDFNKLNNNPDNIRRVGWGEHWRIHYVHASRQHQNPAYRQKIAEGRNKYWADPVQRERRAKMISRANRENWQKSEYREKMRRFLSAVNTQYIKEHPEKREEFSLRFTKTLKRLWQDPSYRAKMHEHIIKGNKNHTTNRTGRLKFLNICKETVRRYGVLREEAYAEVREELYPYGAAPLWETGLGKYFQNNPDLVRHEINRNHRVIKVEDSNECEDVYDLTVDGSHNFALAGGVFVHNSVDGDAPAAMRYSEVKLSRIAEEMLADIEKDTVDWQPNYDGTREEPKVLPAKLPNLLLTGSVGIAVGMTTNIPPHNLREVADAILHLADHPNAAHEELMEFIQGPDFPTGGIIFDKAAIRQAYASGRGSVTMRSVAEIAERKAKESGRGGFDIVITEIPYQVNKAELIVKIAELVQEKRIEGIRDLRDESDKDGLRIVIELKGDAAPQKILNQLYQHTDLQKDFHMNVLALVDGIQPQVLSLKDILATYLAYREQVVRRRTEFDRTRAEERAHILTGLVKALHAIDRVIATIKKSKDREDAHAKLMKTFSLTDIQANAILEMKLQTLAGLEREKIESELKEKKALIEDLALILKHPARIVKLIKEEVKALKDAYGDDRRTKVVAGGLKEFREEDLVPQEDTILTLSAGGYVKRIAPATFRSQRRGGKGLIGSELSEEDFITHFISAKTHDFLLFFTDRGRVFETRTYEIPAANRTSKGKAIHNFLELPSGESVSAVVSYSKEHLEGTGGIVNLFMVTKNGIVKKTRLKDFANIRRNGIIAIDLKKGDRLNWVGLSRAKDEITLITKNGQSIRFKEEQIRAMGRNAAGVHGIRLKSGDEVAGFDIIRSKEKGDGKGHLLLVVMENGFAKQTPIGEYKVQNRGGSGIRTANITKKTGAIIAGKVASGETEIFALSAKGQVIRTELGSVRTTGRAAQGVRIMHLKSGDRLAGVVII